MAAKPKSPWSKPIRRPRPPRSGDVSAVLAYVTALERYVTALEQWIKWKEGKDV